MLSGKKHHIACQMEVAPCEVYEDGEKQFNLVPDGKMFDQVHTEEVEDQMTARLEKAVKIRENMATKKYTGTVDQEGLIFSGNGAMLENN